MKTPFKSFASLLAASVAALAFTLTPASAAVYLTQNATDTYVNQASPNTALDGGGAITVYNPNGNQQISLVKFVLPTLGFGETVTQARIGVHVNLITNFSTPPNLLFMYARDPGQAWNASTLTFNNAPASWKAPGGLFDSSTNAGASVSPSPVTNADVNTFVWFDVTSLAQSWYNTPSNNFGVALVAGGNTYGLFESSESLTPQFSPKFEVTTVPEPSTIAMLGMAGAGALVFFRRRFGRRDADVA